MNYYIEVLKKYMVFEGRSRRAEFWYFALFNFIIIAVLNLIGRGGILSSIYSLAVLLPALGVAIRRLHDIGRSGWFLLIQIIPVIGTIVLLIMVAQDSQPGGNQYGPNPKGM